MDNRIDTPSILVASPHLQDPNFERSVLLLIEHNQDGAVGFIVNRPSDRPLKEMIVEADIEIPAEVPAWTGGPAGTDNGLVLHNQADDESDATITAGINISSSHDALAGLAEYAQVALLSASPAPEEGEDQDEMALDVTQALKRYHSLYPYRFLVGHAGWGAGQLEEEMRLGSWLQLPLNEDLLFNTPWKKIWDEAMATIGINPAQVVPVTGPYLN